MGTTANRGWPYPESSDFVADGATAIENLADAIDASLGEGYAFVQTVYFTTSGTFTKASYPWLRAIRVKLVGGGGGGGGSGGTAAGQCSGGGGGGGAGYAESFITNIAGLAASVTVTVGAGGAGGILAPGSAGGLSSFGGIVSANGGGLGGIVGGSSNGAAAGGSGGIGTAGNITQPGSDGVHHVHLGGFPANKGYGGNSRLSGTTASGASITGVSPGFAGSQYGGGGSGAFTQGTGSAGQTGGAGANGIVIVELYS